MLGKKIYDLVPDDFTFNPVWYFPMDESVEDELSLRPYDINNASPDYQVIVKAVFTDVEGSEYLGYIYWGNPSVIEYLKPVLFCDDEKCIAFWNGILKPSWEEYGADLQTVKNRLPITYRSEAVNNFQSISGVLNGLYFIDDNECIQFV